LRRARAPHGPLIDLGGLFNNAVGDQDLARRSLIRPHKLRRITSRSAAISPAACARAIVLRPGRDLLERLLIFRQTSAEVVDQRKR
jgi:hypothetical protein